MKQKKRWLWIVLIILLFAGISLQMSWKVEAKEAGTGVVLQNPRIETDESLESGQKVTWDCVWFGSYPQSEVKKTDAVYYDLEKASEWDSNNDITLGNAKYRRMKRWDATYSYNGDEGYGYYQWADSTSYHYFKYEPIKWRVLKVENGRAFLRADLGLDDQEYNKTHTSVTWETSTIRSWLNGYGAGSNKDGIDYSSKSFIDNAFTEAQKAAIADTQVDDDNMYYGIEGGNATTDKVFLLSKSEVYGTDAAVSYGFAKPFDTDDNARRCKSSDYAKAMGAWSETSESYSGNCYWWLRSLGNTTDCAVDVLSNGYINRYGFYVNYNISAVCPALNLNQSSSNQYTYAGTISLTRKINSEAKIFWDLSDDGTLTISGTGKMEDSYERPWEESKDKIKKVVVQEGITHIGKSSFYGCEHLAEVSLPDSLESIGEHAFCRCVNLIEINLPDGLKSIGESAFGYTGLSEVSLPEGITDIGDDAFLECSSLKKFSFPKNLEKVYSIFDGCTNLSSVNLPDNVKVLGIGTFSGCSSLSSIELPDSLETIDNSAFSGCSSLYAIHLPESVTRIGMSAFSGCSSLSDVTLPKNLTQLEDHIFYNCNSLFEIKVPDSVVDIGERAFSGCQKLYKVILPNGVKSIGERAFLGCKNLSEIHLPEGISIGEYAFWGCPNLSGTEFGDKLTEISGQCGEQAFWKLSVDGVLTISGTGEVDYNDYLHKFVNGIRKIVIEQGIISIGDMALVGADNLIDISFPSSLENIGEYALYTCTSLSEIILPENVKNVGDRAFWGCINLKKITFLNPNCKVESSESTIKNIEVICGYRGSTAEAYAKAYGKTFVAIQGGEVENPKTSIKESDVTLSQQTYTYDGKAKQPAVTVKDGTKVLVNGTDYTVSYSNNIEIGTAVATVTGKGNYTGTVSKTFMIVKGQAPPDSSTEKPSPGGSTSSTEQPSQGGNESNTEQPSQGGNESNTGQPSQGGNGSNTEQPSQGGNGSNTGQPSQGGNGSNADKPSTDPSNPAPAPKKGTKLTDTKTKASYTVTKQGTAVAYAGATNKNATSVTIPATVKVGNTTYKVTSIAANAFKNNKKLKKATISGNVASIGANAFSGAAALTTVKIGAKVTAIGDKAFYGCKKLSSVTMGKNTASIGKSAFENCTAMKKATIPAKVKKVGSKAFYNCKKLSSITIQSKSLTAKNVGSKAFAKAGNGKKLTVKVPKSKYAAYKKLLKKKGLSFKAKVKKG